MDPTADVVSFLATIATATSTLVAIVGGLLVARVVAIASERNGLRLRLEQLSSEIGKARRRHNDASAKRDKAERRLRREKDPFVGSLQSDSFHEADREVRRLEDEKWQAVLRLESLQHQRDLLDAALARVAKPKGIGWGIVVLSGFAVAGAVVPLYLMLFEERLLPWTPLAVLAGFVAGLAALVVYILVQVRDLTGHPNAEVAHKRKP